MRSAAIELPMGEACSTHAVDGRAERRSITADGRGQLNAGGQSPCGALLDRADATCIHSERVGYCAYFDSAIVDSSSSETSETFFERNNGRKEITDASKHALNSSVL